MSEIARLIAKLQNDIEDFRKDMERAKLATIVLEIDGRKIAEAVVPHIPAIIRRGPP